MTEKAVNAELISLQGKNRRLSEALTQARKQLMEMRTQIEKLGEAPASIGVVSRRGTTSDEAEIFLDGRPRILKIHPRLLGKTLSSGMEVRVSEELIVTRIIGYPQLGSLLSVAEIIEGDRALVKTATQESAVVRLAEHLQGQVQAGDTVLVEHSGKIAVAKIQRTEVEQLLAPQIPNVSYEQIGGLKTQIEQIRDAVELPFKHPELYRQYALRAPKGILLYGPPGCGKTLIAKAVATSLGKESGQASYFLSIKGPELLSKFVGETERQIRSIFNRARQLAGANRPVVVFFDEMEALFRTRGSGISSDVETMIVPQLLAEIDGVDSLSNVIVIGASNREDMIDPAVLRPGRLDVRIRIERPSLAEIAEIFRIHFGPDIPVAPAVSSPNASCNYGLAGSGRDELAARLITLLNEESPRTALYQVTYQDDSSEILYVKSLLSGAMIASIVERAKKEAIKSYLGGKNPPGGVSWLHLEKATLAEITETAMVGASGDGNDWARILGSRDKKVQSVKSLH